MEINYELKPEDFYAFSKENAKTQSSHKPLVIFLLFNYLLFIFADIIYAYFAGSLTNWSLSAFLLNLGIRTALMFGALTILLTVIKFVSLKKMDNVIKGQENGLFCEHRIILTEDELTEVTEFNISHHSWKSISEINETENFVLISVSMSSNYVIPKKYFQDQKQVRNFIETASQYRHNAGNTFQPSYFTKYERSLE